MYAQIVKKKSRLFWRDTNGLVVISLRNRPYLHFTYGLFRRLIATKPLVPDQNKRDFFSRFERTFDMN